MARKLLKALSPAANLDRNALALKFSRDLSVPIFRWLQDLEKTSKNLISCSTRISNSEVLLETNPWFKKMHIEVLNRARDLDSKDYLSAVKDKFKDGDSESTRI